MTFVFDWGIFRAKNAYHVHIKVSIFEGTWRHFARVILKYKSKLLKEECLIYNIFVRAPNAPGLKDGVR